MIFKNSSEAKNSASERTLREPGPAAVFARPRSTRALVWRGVFGLEGDVARLCGADGTVPRAAVVTALNGVAAVVAAVHTVADDGIDGVEAAIARSDAC